MTEEELHKKIGERLDELANLNSKLDDLEVEISKLRSLNSIDEHKLEELRAKSLSRGQLVTNAFVILACGIALGGVLFSIV